MKAWKRLGSLLRSDRGNVLMIGAAAMPLLMASAGLAIDSIQLSFWKRQLQRAADSGAIAGAHAMVQNGEAGIAVDNDLDEHLDIVVDANEKPMLKSRQVILGTFADGTLSGPLNDCGSRAATRCYGQAVQVTLATERWLPFMSMFTRTGSTVTAKGTAALVGNGEFCLVSLYNGTDPGVIAKGNPTLDLGCGIATNSRSASAFDVNGSASIDADPVAAVGGIAGGRWYASGTTLQPYAAPVRDPYAHVPDPVLPSGCTEASTADFTGGTEDEPIEVNPGVCAGSWDVKGHIHLKPGTYYVNNGTLDIKGSITGENVTLVLMGDDSTWTQNGGGIMDLTAPTSGPYKGIVVFRDREATNTSGKEIKLNGGAYLKLTGAIYGPSTDFWIGGNADIDSECIQIVGRKLEFKGGGKIQNKCQGTGAGAFRTTMVRLVD